MKRTIATASVLVIMSVVACAWQTAPQASAVQKSPSAQKAVEANRKKTPPKKASKVPPPVPQLPAQIMPPMPATLMNSAPVKPNVTLESGLLTIDAPNSTLSDVLNAVHGATGATIEGASPTERVAVKLGPGSPEQVIAALLRGTPYDYVILGTLGRQDMVTRVVLTQQSNQPSPGDSAQARAGQPMSSPPQPAFQPPIDSQPERTAPDDTAPPPPTESQAGQAQPTPPQPQPDPNAPKTPEQLFKELQQLQQQRQQQQPK
jgi:hypothetical protein